MLDPSLEAISAIAWTRGEGGNYLLVISIRSDKLFVNLEFSGCFHYASVVFSQSVTNREGWDLDYCVDRVEKYAGALKPSCVNVRALYYSYYRLYLLNYDISSFYR